jgi:hypothetical protein
MPRSPVPVLRKNGWLVGISLRPQGMAQILSALSRSALQKESMSMISREEFPHRAFQLAYFIHRERRIAVEIATRALNKLQLAATAQGKRLYYRLTGRADARKARSKVSMGEPHLLQRLIYIESEEYERRKEAASLDPQAHSETTPARHSDLVVYFIKHLIRITTRRNSFYVTLGLSRLLYNYTTAETMELYNVVVQNPDRVHDDYYYRSRKGVLMNELKERFGDLIEVNRSARGEQRWRAGANHSEHFDLAAECLRQFTPWSTPCVVPPALDPLTDTIVELNFEGRHPDEEHEVEVNRIHAAMHPECFARLTAANRFAPPQDRLELPHFFIADGADDRDGDSRTPPKLSQEELEAINGLLAQEAMRRKSASAGLLRVLVDGVERAEITAMSETARFKVDENAELLEVYDADASGPLLLATHVLNPVDGPAQKLTITLEGGQTINFNVDPLHDSTGSWSGAALTVALTEAARAAEPRANRLWAWIFDRTGPMFGWLKPAAALALLLLLFAGAWWLWRNRQDVPRIAQVNPTPAPTAMPSTPTTSPANNEKSNHGEPTVKQPTTQPLNSAVPLIANNNQKPRRVKESLVERSFLPSTDAITEPGENATRGSWDRTMGKSLKEIRRVYLQGTADNDSTKQLTDQLRTQLANDGVTISTADSADAALKISAQRASDQPNDSRVVVVIRAVNANGYVVWPDSRRRGSWKYVGQTRFVAQRIANDLKKAVR